MPTVVEILAKTLRVKIEELDESTTIEQVDTWDSLTHMELVADLETAFKIEFTGDEIAEMTSVGSIVSLVEGKSGN